MRAGSARETPPRCFSTPEKNCFRQPTTNVRLGTVVEIPRFHGHTHFGKARSIPNPKRVSPLSRLQRIRAFDARGQNEEAARLIFSVTISYMLLSFATTSCHPGYAAASLGPLDSTITGNLGLIPLAQGKHEPSRRLLTTLWNTDTRPPPSTKFWD